MYLQAYDMFELNKYQFHFHISDAAVTFTHSQGQQNWYECVEVPSLELDQIKWYEWMKLYDYN